MIMISGKEEQWIEWAKGGRQRSVLADVLEAIPYLNGIRRSMTDGCTRVFVGVRFDQPLGFVDSKSPFLDDGLYIALVEGKRKFIEPEQKNRAIYWINGDPTTVRKL